MNVCDVLVFICVTVYSCVSSVLSVCRGQQQAQSRSIKLGLTVSILIIYKLPVTTVQYHHSPLTHPAGQQHQVYSQQNM